MKKKMKKKKCFRPVYKRGIPLKTYTKSNTKVRDFIDFNKNDDWYCFDRSDGINKFGGF